MSEVGKFELFSLLPLEIRHLVWRKTLEGRLVAICPRLDWLARRSRLPVMSAVHQESRKFFLSIYIRLISEVTGMPHNRSSFDWLIKDHVYLNPDIDTLILGTSVHRLGDYRLQLANPQWLVQVDGLGRPLVVPTLPDDIKKRLRKLRLHDTCFLQRIFNERLSRGKALTSSSSQGPIPFPQLQFPCLEVIYLVSLICIPIPTNLGLKTLSLRGTGVHLRYILPTNKLHCHRDAILPSEYFGGIRPNEFTPHDCFRVDANESCCIRIDILRDSNLDWITDD
ncbi:hypothetical protein CSAL01_09819 [Colletotrichum salicis]|uniref:2EXR domain-containing protein n=1 Tax=Colletotrichum salicis TaxID=1209931 RepID=A0A135TY47_9PEZI|nr:hypothetical protein CSAL01_09819 [Colletotrichum salicis]